MVSSKPMSKLGQLTWPKGGSSTESYMRVKTEAVHSHTLAKIWGFGKYWANRWPAESGLCCRSGFRSFCGHFDTFLDMFSSYLTTGKHCNTINPHRRHTIMTDLYSAEPCVVPARTSAGWSPAGTPKLLHGGWLEELSAAHHCPAACWHQPRSQWHSHLPVHTIRDVWMYKTHTVGTPTNHALTVGPKIELNTEKLMTSWETNFLHSVRGVILDNNLAFKFSTCAAPTQ